MSSTKIAFAVLGGGSWGTALVKILADNGHPIHWWIREQENIPYIRQHGHNPQYLRQAHLRMEKITLHTHGDEAVAAAEAVLYVTPAAYIGSVVQPLDAGLLRERIAVTAIKGIEPESNLIISSWLRDRLGIPAHRIAVIGGPCHAEEVAMDLSAYLTVGAFDSDTGRAIAAALRRPHIHASVLQDVDGIEYAAVLKNIYALATGIAQGMSEGDNFKAVLVSAAAREMEQFLRAVAPGNRDICHSVYLGDLLVTAYSLHSRNRTFGSMIGQGFTPKTAQLEMKMVAEGYSGSRCIYRISQGLGLRLPLADAVYSILYESVPPRTAFERLKDGLY